jgi:hypothetical protein
MGKGRDKRRRKQKEVARPAKVEPPPAEPLDPYASVLSPLKPKPPLRSGAIALPEPDEPEFADLTAPAGRGSKNP